MFHHLINLASKGHGQQLPWPQTLMKMRMMSLNLTFEGPHIEVAPLAPQTKNTTKTPIVLSLPSPTTIEVPSSPQEDQLESEVKKGTKHLYQTKSANRTSSGHSTEPVDVWAFFKRETQTQRGLCASPVSEISPIPASLTTHSLSSYHLTTNPMCPPPQVYLLKEDWHFKPTHSYSSKPP